MMKTVEELQGMTHEDLVRLVQELNEANTELKKSVDVWVKMHDEIKSKHESFLNAVKSIVSLTE